MSLTEYISPVSAALVMALSFLAARNAAKNGRKWMPLAVLCFALALEVFFAHGSYLPWQVRTVRDLACAWVLVEVMRDRKRKGAKMANALYSKGKQALLEGSIAWLTDSFKVVAVDLGAYTPDLANHQFLSDIPGGARIATSGNLSGKSSTGGVADAADISIPGVTGPTVEAIVIYKDTGTDTTSSLLAYYDSASGLVFTPNGGSLDITWSNGTSKIFAI